MKVRIGTLGGQEFESDYVSDEEMIKALDEIDWNIGTDAWVDEFQVERGNLDALVVTMEKVFKKALSDEVDNGYISLNIKGNNRVFPAGKVVWFEVVR